jgi:mRNA interferase RelE/StbE
VHDILLERSVERDLRRLRGDVFDRVIAAIQDLAHDPRPDGCRKIEGSQNDWRIRVGDYRIVYEVDDANHQGGFRLALIPAQMGRIVDTEPRCSLW